MVEPQKMPTFDELMWPTLQALKQTGGSASNEELLAQVVQIAGLPEEIQNIPYRNGTLLDDRLHWARTYLRKVGAIESSKRAVWSITSHGRALTKADVKNIPAQVKEILRKTAVVTAPDQQMIDGPESDETWQDQLLSILQAMAPGAFERLAQRILRESGFIKVEVKGQPGDGGIDGIGVLRLNLLSFQVFFQCKRYKDSVGAGAIRDFRGAMVGRTDKGLFITTGRFTPDAKQEAARDGAPQIELIDGAQLCELLKTLGLGTQTQQVEQVTVIPDAFKEFESSTKTD